MVSSCCSTVSTAPDVSIWKSTTGPDAAPAGLVASKLLQEDVTGLDSGLTAAEAFLLDDVDYLFCEHFVAPHRA